MVSHTDYMHEAEPTADREFELRPFDDFLAYLREYTRERPEVVALACFTIGFVLGWRLKPW
jgi:hypothetical protein